MTEPATNDPGATTVAPGAGPADIRAYYFGCARGINGHRAAGHFFNAPGHIGRVTAREAQAVVPWERVDGALAPRKGTGRYAEECAQGVAALHHLDGWTALAFWDRTGDSRGASNSVFFFEGDWDFDHTLKLAREHFPEVLNRLTFPIVEASA